MAAEQALVVDFAASVHSIDAIKRAAYVFMARATVIIEPAETDIRCILEPTSGEDHGVLIRDFRREVLDQDLRVRIEAETEPLRNVILGLAFSRITQHG